jgi:hypothetical protein
MRVCAARVRDEFVSNVSECPAHMSGPPVDRTLRGEKKGECDAENLIVDRALGTLHLGSCGFGTAGVADVTPE